MPSFEALTIIQGNFQNTKARNFILIWRQVFMKKELVIAMDAKGRKVVSYKRK